METIKKQDRSSQRLRDLNPCYDESLISLKCQESKGKDHCEREIANYKTCTDFWNQVYDLRRFLGIRPFSPKGEERQQIVDSLKRSKNPKQTLREISEIYKHLKQ